MIETVEEIRLEGHGPLRRGMEFSIQAVPGAYRQRIRFTRARLTPKGVELTGMDKHGRTRTVRADLVDKIHRTQKLDLSWQEECRPASRRRVR